MTSWPKHPLIYEINTWVWLDELSRRAARRITLASTPDEEWDRIGSIGFDAVWLMGVWKRSAESIRISMSNQALLSDFRNALPDFVPDDNVGSPYCVRSYAVDDHLGGTEGLTIARSKLAERGLRLVLDFVPNHVAPDHPWVSEHPEYFIQGNKEDLEGNPDSFMNLGGRICACGRDPYFPAWSDVLQLNAFHPGLRLTVIGTLADIAGQCDGVRCDMAMLLMNAVFERTWGDRVGTTPETDYWPQVIPAVKTKYPDFQFIAEAYWDLEWALQKQGFDYCYDKRLYDRLEHDSAESVRLHLCAGLDYQSKLIRFIENHDEPRAAAVFDMKRHRTSAVTALTLPGAGLVHEGQMEGRITKLPVFLARRQEELPDLELYEFYCRLLETLHGDGLLQGTWRLCERFGWADNASYLNLVSWCWRNGSRFCLIVVNLSNVPSQGRVRVPWMDLKGKRWRLMEIFSSAVYERDGDEICGPGIYVDLPEWGFHFLKWQMD
jgi:hypothetical protein